MEHEFRQHKERIGKRKLNEIVNECQTLSKKITELMKCSEKYSGSVPYKDGFPASPELREKAFQMIRIKKYVRLVAVGEIKVSNEEKEKIKIDLKNSQQELRDAQKNSTQLREEYLYDLAEK